MKCIVCNGESVEVGDIMEEVRVDNDIVRVPIRTPVCRTCGERYYDRRTMQLLEETELRLRRGRTDLHEIGKVLMYA